MITHGYRNQVRNPPRMKTRLHYVAGIYAPLFMALSIMASAVVFAAPITIPITAISTIPAGAPQQPDESLDAFRARRLMEQLGALGLNAETGMVFSRFPVEASSQELATTCPVPLPKAIQTDATEVQVNLDPQSTVTFNLDSLRDLSVRLDLVGELHAMTAASVQWGQAIPFVGNCEKIGTDSGTLTVHLPFVLRLSINVRLTPQFDDQQLAFIVEKLAQAEGTLDLGDGWIDPDFGGASLTGAVIKAFEDNLLGRMRDRGTQQFSSNIQRLNNRFAGLDAAGNRDETIDPFNGATVFPLVKDAASNETAVAIARDLNIGNLIITLFDTRGADVLLQLLVLDDAGRKQFLADLGASLLCDALLARYEATQAPQAPLYSIDGNNNCVATDPFGPDQNRYFLDGACATEVAYRPTSKPEFCAATLGDTAKGVLGNAAAWTVDAGQINDVLPQLSSRKWTALQSSRLNIGVLANDSLSVPYTKLINYKQIATNPGDPVCELEMRVYKKEIGATGLRPLLAIHGGTWESRGFSWVGLEATVAQFTERGFIVFAPFYRLAGTDDGNAACHGVGWREITADVDDALGWVDEFGAALGAGKQPVTLFGQSSGAHLAAWLTVTRATQVERALLYYPPSDVLEFLRGTREGGPFTAFRSFGENALARFFGARLGTREIRFDRINLTAANPNLGLDQWLEWVADDTVDWSTIDWQQPSIYLRQCAVATQVDLATIDPVNLPRTFVDCVKRELGEFISANAFHQRVSVTSPPVFVIHGIADSLVPWQQSAGLCQALAGAPLKVEPVGIDTVIPCGGNRVMHLIEGAQHALDFGLCVGALCPAGAPGSPTRLAVNDTLVAGLNWIQESPPVAPVIVADTRRTARGSGGGGSVTFASLVGLLLVMMAGRRRPTDIPRRLDSPPTQRVNRLAHRFP